MSTEQKVTYNFPNIVKKDDNLMGKIIGQPINLEDYKKQRPLSYQSGIAEHLVKKGEIYRGYNSTTPNNTTLRLPLVESVVTRINELIAESYPTEDDEELAVLTYRVNPDLFLLSDVGIPEGNPNDKRSAFFALPRMFSFDPAVAPLHIPTGTRTGEILVRIPADSSVGRRVKYVSPNSDNGLKLLAKTNDPTITRNLIQGAYYKGVIPQDDTVRVTTPEGVVQDIYYVRNALAAQNTPEYNIHIATMESPSFRREIAANIARWSNAYAFRRDSRNTIASGQLLKSNIYRVMAFYDITDPQGNPVDKNKYIEEFANITPSVGWDVYNSFRYTLKEEYRGDDNRQERVLYSPYSFRDGQWVKDRNGICLIETTGVGMDASARAIATGNFRLRLRPVQLRNGAVKCVPTSIASVLNNQVKDTRPDKKGVQLPYTIIDAYRGKEEIPYDLNLASGIDQLRIDLVGESMGILPEEGKTLSNDYIRNQLRLKAEQSRKPILSRSEFGRDSNIYNRFGGDYMNYLTSNSRELSSQDVNIDLSSRGTYNKERFSYTRPGGIERLPVVKLSGSQGQQQQQTFTQPPQSGTGPQQGPQTFVQPPQLGSQPQQQSNPPPVPTQNPMAQRQTQ